MGMPPHLTDIPLCGFNSAHKRLDLQMLFDAFEKQLDLPAGLVDVGNRLGT